MSLATDWTEDLPKDAEAAATFAAILSSRRFDAHKPPPPAQPIYEINGQCICTPGNITAVSAHIKSGKYSFVGAFIAASFGLDGDTLGIDSANPNEHALIHFDTEQSPADHHNLIRIALFRVNREEAPAWLRSYRIADVPLAERFPLLEYEVERAKKAHGGIHSVLLDGSADYVKDLNNPEESFCAVERLHRLAVQYVTTIICVIHINPGSENGKTRGHFGSQLARKAESNLRLVKANEVVTAYTESSRHASISQKDGPRFRWDFMEQMHMSCGTKREETSTADALRLRCIAEEVFEQPQRYSAAITRIMNVAKVKERQAETTFSEIHKAGLITKNLIGQWELTR